MILIIRIVILNLTACTDKIDLKKNILVRGLSGRKLEKINEPTKNRIKKQLASSK